MNQTNKNISLQLWMVSPWEVAKMKSLSVILVPSSGTVCIDMQLLDWDELNLVYLHTKHIKVHHRIFHV